MPQAQKKQHYYSIRLKFAQLSWQHCDACDQVARLSSPEALILELCVSLLICHCTTVLIYVHLLTTLNHVLTSVCLNNAQQPPLPHAVFREQLEIFIIIV